MSYDEVVQITCPACGAHTYHADSLLGRLGNLEHFRCRQCGAQFSRLINQKGNDQSLGDAGC